MRLRRLTEETPDGLVVEERAFPLRPAPEQGVPFREAHSAIAGIVTQLEAEGRTFGDVKPDEWQKLDPRLDEETGTLLDPEISISRRDGKGGPSPNSVRAQARKIRGRLSQA